MPEIRECVTDEVKVTIFISNEDGSNRTVLALYYDCTIGEGKRAPAGSRARQGHVTELQSSSTVVRGQRVSQTSLYPTPYRDPSNIPISQHGLVLQSAEATPRSLILSFAAANGDELWCEVQLFQHTLTQIYTIDEWDNAVMQIPCRTEKGVEPRGFRVSLAFRFANHVLSFNSLDNITQFHWARRRADLPRKVLDVRKDGQFEVLLQNIAAWVHERRHCHSAHERQHPAINSLRSAQNPDKTPLFPGLGVYTTSEVWFSAGLPPNLTEEELCDEPDRLARLISAYYHFVVDAHPRMKAFIRPYLHGYLLAVDAKRDRRAYEQGCLRVYGCDAVGVTHRYGVAVTDAMAFWAKANAERSETPHADVVRSWLRTRDQCPHDPFEPSYVRHALELAGSCNLGAVIFGLEHWRRLCLDAGLPSDCISTANPIWRLFNNPAEVAWLREHGREPSALRAWLNMDLYDTLFSNARNTDCRLRTEVYNFNCDFWSCIPAYPHLSMPTGHPLDVSRVAAARRKLAADAQALADQQKRQHDVECARKLAITSGNSALPPRRGGQAGTAVVAPDDGTTWRSFYQDPLAPVQGSKTGFKFEGQQRQTRLIQYITEYHYKKYTVGPLDFCGVARIVRSGKSQFFMVCERDPRVPQFIQRRRLLAISTALYSAHGNRKHGLPAADVQRVDKQTPLPPSKRKSESDLELTAVQTGEGSENQKPAKKMRRSADRDLALLASVGTSRRLRRSKA
ncbi:uncharacterized protein SCHCODRAFT_02606677 [Schizophyllum commune H4-8]|uniref:uncharacterized protein n=1 Tax=Schizophyllum commune (strain H4-8 / FGSC 9210) TaxID=578458 RepID=UPI00215E584A|nr:uncharacterized protein SCHCODRAFT_02606677 [Schizophyllum commune H4-8]KAI5899986.1 hypothetical protein SCHCODRAFT_02606677 [Schizophyllum commune H4-8]